MENILRISVHSTVLKRMKQQLCFFFLKRPSLFENDFISDVKNIPFHIGEVFDDADDKLFFIETLFTQVYGEHVPLK